MSKIQMSFLSDQQVRNIQKTLTSLFYKSNYISKKQQKRFIGVLPQALKQQDLKYFQPPLEDLSDWKQKQLIVDELFHHWQSNRRSEHTSKIRVISELEHRYIQTKKQTVSFEKVSFSIHLIELDERTSFDNLAVYQDLLLHIVQS